MSKRQIRAAFFLLYALVMLWLLLLRRTPRPISLEEAVQSSTNLVPFATIRHQLRLLGGPWTGFAVKNLVGNVVLFIPLGFLPALGRSPRRSGWCLLLAALLIAAVEAAQLLLRVGSADVDDWLLNMLGVLLGYGIWKWKAKQI